MNQVKIDRVDAHALPGEAAQAERLSRRLAELLGEQLAMGDAVLPRRKLVVELPREAGWNQEQMAQRIAQEILSKLA